MSEAEEAIINTCDPRNYPCDPEDPISNGVCEWICGQGNPGDGYCQPHTGKEEIYCFTHPDTFISPTKYCGVDGRPIWYTRCVPGAVP